LPKQRQSSETLNLITYTVLYPNVSTDFLNIQQFKLNLTELLN